MIRIGVYAGSAWENDEVHELLRRYQMSRPHLILEIYTPRSSGELLQLQAHIYLLEVHLPDMDGLEAARRLREMRPDAVILFLTHSSRHALEAYQVRALQYLLKPVEKEAFFQAMDEALFYAKRLRGSRLGAKTAQGLQWLDTDEIVYLRPVQHTVQIVLRGGQKIQTQNLRISFTKYVEPLIASGEFVRPHHSYVVNKAYIEQLVSDALILWDETVIPVSHSKHQQMRAMFQGKGGLDGALWLEKKR